MLLKRLTDIINGRIELESEISKYTKVHAYSSQTQRKGLNEYKNYIS